MCWLIEDDKVYKYSRSKKSGDLFYIQIRPKKWQNCLPCHTLSYMMFLGHSHTYSIQQLSFYMASIYKNILSLVQVFNHLCKYLITCASIWSLVQVFDYLCEYLITCASIWSLVRVFDHLCKYLITCWSIWSLVQIFDQSCEYVITCASIWSIVWVFDHLCQYLITCASIWSLVQVRVRIFKSMLLSLHLCGWS